MMTTPHPTHLTPSQLGTKDYWDKTYTHDLRNHAHNRADIGTVWFSDSLAEEKILEYLLSDELGLDRETTNFLDVGAGNGGLLFSLRRGGVRRRREMEKARGRRGSEGRW
ncbi:MAG: N-lysine methyltransferase SEE1 [Lasallia pustulata]|uniref:N-lysine methyltransferase SEE1 n=1 Tax=Lasallia pustulata TaxID=136370 RepID=A0A5M8PF93_9LECA|nr:MAG: N-lysine methyltransferase SEE1 [Lasallia pustulata]